MIKNYQIGIQLKMNLMESKKFNIKLEPLAKSDIQQIIHFYNEKQKGLGEKFYREIVS